MEYQKNHTKASKSLQWNNSETVSNQNDKERYISPEERQKNWWSKINNNGVIMEYQKLINLLNNIPNHPNKCETKNWVKINDKSRGT